MTWFVKDDGYELFFNRDERISRSHAELPSAQQQDGVRYISPTDADAGGSWIAANQFGVTICLLNHYQFEQIETYKNWISRGEIVRRFATIRDLQDIQFLWKKLEFDNFRAFRMFIIDREGNNRLCVWDGHEPRIEKNVTMPKSSSSVDAVNVKATRKQLFADLGLHDSTCSKEYIKYHASHTPSKSKDSVCMHRRDANTVSLSHVVVDSNTVSFAYADGPPCEAPLIEALNIELQEIEQALPQSSSLSVAAR